jgi:hypothetical protein
MAQQKPRQDQQLMIFVTLSLIHGGFIHDYVTQRQCIITRDKEVAQLQVSLFIVKRVTLFSI